MKKFVIILIALILIFMSIEIWGSLQKSLTDNETIEQAIARLIAVHEGAPTSHLGAGESIEQHKMAEVIDHPAQSIVPDKFNSANNLIFLPVSGDLSEWASNYSSIGWGYVMFMDHASPLVSSASMEFYEIVLSDINYTGGDIVEDLIFHGYGTSGTWNVQFSNYFAGIEIKQGYYRLKYYDTVWHYSDWISFTVTQMAKWRIHYNSIDHELDFYRNGVLVFSVSYTIPVEYTSMLQYIEATRGSSSACTVLLGNIFIGIDSSV